MNGNDSQDYGERTVLENAERSAADLIERAIRHQGLRRANPDFDVRAEVYARARLRTEMFMVAGNGPTEWVCFVLDDDGDIHHAYFLYCSASGSSTIVLGQFDAEDLYKLMRAYQ
jgi:hypothetical protein